MPSSTVRSPAYLPWITYLIRYRVLFFSISLRYGFPSYLSQCDEGVAQIFSSTSCYAFLVGSLVSSTRGTLSARRKRVQHQWGHLTEADIEAGCDLNLRIARSYNMCCNMTSSSKIQNSITPLRKYLISDLSVTTFAALYRYWTSSAQYPDGFLAIWLDKRCFRISGHQGTSTYSYI
jgi:hypothetical protein